MEWSGRSFSRVPAMSPRSGGQAVFEVAVMELRMEGFDAENVSCPFFGGSC